MDVGAVRYNGHRATNPRGHVRSGSEAIRKRVAHLMQSTVPASTDRVNPPSPRSPSPRSNSSRETRPLLVSKDKVVSIPPMSGLTRAPGKTSLGRFGSSDRPENRSSTTLKLPVTSSVQQDGPRVFDAMARLPKLEHDLNMPMSQRKGRVGSSKHPSHNPEMLPVNDIPVYEKGQVDVFRGSLAVAEYDRMKKEIEFLKEALQDSRKTSKRNLKKLEEVKAELKASLLAAQSAQSELIGIKENHKKNEELLSSIESSVQCQICMDLPDKPFALSPCGHILCVSCLQEWFRKAPPTMDDIDIDPDELTDPHYVLMRSKSCPTCRAIVKRRPVPVFMVKSIASAIQKAKESTLSTDGPSTALGSNGPHPEIEDPWKGIFPSSGDDSEEADSAEDYGFLSDFEGNEEPHALLELFHRHHQHRMLGGNMFAAFDLSSDSDTHEESEEEESLGDESEEELVLPRWAPPSAESRPDERHLMWQESLETLKLLRRGCNPGMVHNFDIVYSHHDGIIVSLHSLDQLYVSDSDHDSSDDRNPTAMNRVYLGWNISLYPHDTDGEIYLEGILEDIKNNPSQWLVTPRPGVRGARDAKRLVHLDEVEAYDTTDSETWIDGNF